MHKQHQCHVFDSQGAHKVYTLNAMLLSLWIKASDKCIHLNVISSPIHIFGILDTLSSTSFMSVISAFQCMLHTLPLLKCKWGDERGKKWNTKTRMGVGEWGITESRMHLMVHVCQFARNNLQPNSISETRRGPGGWEASVSDRARALESYK